MTLPVSTRRATILEALPKPNGAQIAAAASLVAGAALITLGALGQCGPLGSVGMLSSVGAGTALTLIFVSGLVAAVKLQEKEPPIEIGVYPAEGEAAFTTVRTFLDQHGQDVPETLSGRKFVLKLHTLFWKKSYEQLKTALQTNQEDPWNSSSVIEAADKLMQLAYAIGVLTLENLEADKETYDTKHPASPRTYAELLTLQDGYQYRTFYPCTQVYHWLRGAIAWREDPHYEDRLYALGGTEQVEREGFFFEFDAQKRKYCVPKDHEARFYAPETKQAQWRTLYNDYCRRIRLYVPKKELYRADSRHANWTQPDQGPHTFKHTPDTLPT